MENLNVSKIMLLAVFLGAGGCSSVPLQSGFEAEQRPILSAEQAETMIQVTVTTLPSAETQSTIVAANSVD